VKTTSSVCDRAPFAGASAVSVGMAGTVTVNARSALDPPPGAGLLTRTFRVPIAALDRIETFAVSCVELLTVTELIVRPLPGEL
jgi:hypothetical protein